MTNQSAPPDQPVRVGQCQVAGQPEDRLAGRVGRRAPEQKEQDGRCQAADHHPGEDQGVGRTLVSLGDQVDTQQRRNGTEKSEDRYQ